MHLKRQEYSGSTRPTRSGDFPPKAADGQTATVRWPPKDGQPTQTAKVLVHALNESRGNELACIHDQDDRRRYEGLVGLQECGA